jgi:hypothetical protein
MCFKVSGTKVSQCLSGEYDAPAKRIVGAIPFEYSYVVARIGNLHQDGEVKTCRSAPDNINSHLVWIVFVGTYKQS